jgi:hydrogenase maturation protein HypF
MSAAPQAVYLRVRGIVQGVGFRPFAARLAVAHGLSGWVRNDLQGVLIRIDGGEGDTARFIQALRIEAPPASRIESLERLGSADLEASEQSAVDAAAFSIIESRPEGAATLAVLPPDLALCPACRAELLDPENRRFGYPFINCTQCGPRYSIVDELPYDRPNTSMRGFPLCESCKGEYGQPLDRRFHAEPNACPKCGPSLGFHDGAGLLLSSREKALDDCVAALRRGFIVAVKGIGGYHLMADASNEEVVANLRCRKKRDAKPLALLFASLEEILGHCVLDPASKSLLLSPAAPIVLLPRREESRLASSLAPGNPYLGAMLAYSPLHLLLSRAFAGPLVATSGNLVEEPLCTTEPEVFERLQGIADFFLTHDRPIVRPIDDSVLRPSKLGPIPLRRARGYAPRPIALPPLPEAVADTLCLGGHLKATVAVLHAGQLVLSPHIGDLSTSAALDAYRRNIDLLVSLLRCHPKRLVCDAHPDYASTQYALASGLPVLRVQHHLAHVLSCLAEQPQLPERSLGISWDGTGYGSDGTIWGGEFIEVDLKERRALRRGWLLPFPLPGGDAAILDSRRSALGLLHKLHENDASAQARAAAELGFNAGEASLLLGLLTQGRHAPLTSSMGRLFDSVAVLLGLGSRNHFEGQNAMGLEFAAASAAGPFEPLPFALLAHAQAGVGEAWLLDWRPALRVLLAERGRGTAAAQLAARFHLGLARAAAELAGHCGIEAIPLSGGCFQNRLLLELCHAELSARGLQPLLHRELPPNDGGLSAGQALAAVFGLGELRG